MATSSFGQTIRIKDAKVADKIVKSLNKNVLPPTSSAVRKDLLNSKKSLDSLIKAKGK